jgi:hypothetical protein
MMDSVTQPEPQVDEQQPAGRSILSQGQGDRFDRWIEFLSAIVLSLATVIAAWCGYQAAVWDGEQADAYNRASAARIEATQKRNEALVRNNLNAGLFVQYAAAISQENERLAGFLYGRFPPELRVATDAWQATDPLNRLDAPLTPFHMPEYSLPQVAEAQQFEQSALQAAEEANRANELSDRYVLLTVIFAMVLFFGGISGKFQWRAIDAGILVLGVVVMLVGVGLLLQWPIG